MWFSFAVNQAEWWETYVQTLYNQTIFKNSSGFVKFAGGIETEYWLEMS